MQEKIHWITNLRGIACMMVVMIHSTSWYITHPHAITLLQWDIANLLNSASRVSVPLFFMISGYLFFGERSAQPRHFWLCAALFIAAVWVISRGTLHELRWRGDFGDTWYLYCGPAVFVCAVTLLTLAKNWLNARPLPGIACIARHSLGIYGFHALIVHALRASHLELSRWPLLDIVWIFSAALLGSLLLSGLVQRIDSRRLVS